MNCENFIRFSNAVKGFTWAKLNHPELTKDFYGVEMEEKRKELHNDNFMKQLVRVVKTSRIFEIGESEKKLLSLSEPPNKNDDLHYPFPMLFIDVAFTKEELADLGININAEEIVGIGFEEGVLILDKEQIEKKNDDLAFVNEKNLLNPSNDGKIVGTDLRITILSINKGEAWFDTFNKNCNIVDENLRLMKVKIMENPTTDKKMRDFVYKFVLNFLNFVNNPEIEIVEHRRDEKNMKRREKQGKSILPSNYSIRVTGKLKEYIDAMVQGNKFHFTHRFWIRGHFRRLQAPRYIEKKVLWILPYVKGSGVLIDKTYHLKKKGEEK